MLEMTFVGKTSQAHLLVTGPRMHPMCSAKGSFKESSEASPAQHKGILENIPMFDTTCRDQDFKSSHSCSRVTTWGAPVPDWA
ncbi:hypothetical protein A2U01_0074108 [Trifolium medium]|uniref:Uncharacterized protein n=1 Tax=Trifolium medium TaxID=97028 RepID=A0A392SWN6_9FABA|nr:hypothetical protein [Trifolium medium]